MTITYFGNYLNHHSLGISDAFYNAIGDGFHFVATLPVDPAQLKGGGDYSHQRRYCLPVGDTPSLITQANMLAVSSDVCLFGGDSLHYAVLRAKKNPKGLSFEVGERCLKRGVINILSPRLIQWWWSYFRFFEKSNFYYLCSSAFAAQDLNFLGAYKDRCFKWGYFTKVDEDFDVVASKLDASTSEITPLMWCARFLKWKHPELPVQLAARLKAKGYRFTIDMFGGGEEFENTKKLISRLGVEDCVKLRGNLPNEDILNEMRKHDIFLFTSDRNEGWGAVANEAMSNGCALVASDEIGSTPFLIQNGVTGLSFKSRNVDDFTKKVKMLIDNPEFLTEIRRNSCSIMQSVWNPSNAVDCLLNLIDDLSLGKELTIVEGPCSRSY